jgi:5-formyltetrahydrofolate cyclo-ligase
MKDKLRQEILQKRNSLTPEQVQSKSLAIINRLVMLDIYQKATHVMLYLDFRNEVRTIPLIHQLMDAGKKVFIPVTNPEDFTLTISELKDPEEDLVRVHFGLLEPRPDSLRPVDPQIIDLVIVPGLVFDEQGYRIGFGAGYYDRFLVTLSPDVPLISLLYELQLVDQVPREPHDIPVHLLVTEERIIRCQSDR